MPRYIQKTLQHFKHPEVSKKEDAPHDYLHPTYEAKSQLMRDAENEEILSLSDIEHVHAVIRMLLNHALAIDNAMLVALDDLASMQTKSTATTLEAITRLLNYAATHPDAKICFHASGMTLHIHSNGFYLSAPKS